MPAGGLLILLMQGSDHGTGGLPHVARAKPESKLSCPHFAHQNITAGNAGGVLQILSQMPPETVDDLGATFNFETGSIRQVQVVDFGVVGFHPCLLHI